MGPQAGAMEPLGSKTAGRQLARRADVPAVPGTNDPIENPAEALALAQRVGYPVLLKAVAGGGGKGMRLVYRDRKSTRLNSSHSQISYAPFCLKKQHLQRPRLCFPARQRRRRRSAADLHAAGPIPALHRFRFAPLLLVLKSSAGPRSRSE